MQILFEIVQGHAVLQRFAAGVTQRDHAVERGARVRVAVRVDIALADGQRRGACLATDQFDLGGRRRRLDAQRADLQRLRVHAGTGGKQQQGGAGVPS